MEERESESLCDGCPYQYHPGEDVDVDEIIEIYSLSCNREQSTDTIIGAYKGNISRFEYLRIIQGLNTIDNKRAEITNKRRVNDRD